MFPVANGYVPVSSATLSPSSSVEVIEGTSFTFSCVSKASRPAANITWYSDGVVVSGSSSSTSTNNLLYDVTSNLTSSYQRTDNEKRIYCTAVNINGDTPIQSSQAQLNVIYAPPAAPQLTTDGSTSVDEGQSITLRCTLSTLGNPHITWSWVCGDDTLTTGVTNTGTQSELTLTANRKYNQRTCQCRATSPRSSLLYNRTSGTRTIIVYYNNVITSNLYDEYVTSEHGRLQIKCYVDGNPLSSITWLFVQNNTVVKRDSDVSSSSLDISSANCVDHGVYKVTADNGKGTTAVRTTHVAVRCKPRLYSMDSDKLGIGNNESLQILVRMLLYPQATLIQWTLSGENNKRKVIQNNTDGFSITDSKGENKQNITLYKRSVKTGDFGEYTLVVLNDVGTFTRIYHVDAGRPPLKPTNLTLVCATSSVKLSWISNFNGGDSQTFKISYSTVGDSTYQDIETISDQGYGRFHSYTLNIELQGTVWFTVTASNMFGNSTSDHVHCILKGIQEEVSRQTEAIVGSVVGSVAFIIAVLVLVIFLRRRYKCTCRIKMEIERIDESVKTADLFQDGSQIPLAQQNIQGER
ncbi:peroxidasin-like [Ostrea edulis]|uniref:peroxidasin-like n=1 Tax=Ostrea edulis TaxID=37623 RepID=UPI0024AF2060|nr:peroxidasin-like [Ostrea edulis]